MTNSQMIANQLMTAKRRQASVQQLKVAGVWLALLLILVLILLQLRFDPAYIWANRNFVLAGLWTTLYVSFVSILIASVLALFGALGRLSTNPMVLGISGFYVSLFRGTPLLVQIYLIYSGLPQIGTQLRELGYPGLGSALVLSGTLSGILALSLNYGAYMTEIFRAGIQSVSSGQWQAAAALGMSWWQTFRLIVLPQALRTVIPAIGNQFIAMQKDSTLVSLMGVWEITYRANRFARKDSKFMEMFLLAAAIYWVLTVISEWLQGRLEKRMEQGEMR